jgi:hypothetical protein
VSGAGTVETRTCSVCGTTFYFSSADVDHWKRKAAERNWKGDPLPRRCRPCREAGFRPGTRTFRTTNGR